MADELAQQREYDDRPGGYERDAIDPLVEPHEVGRLDLELHCPGYTIGHGLPDSGAVSYTHLTLPTKRIV